MDNKHVDNTWWKKEPFDDSIFFISFLPIDSLIHIQYFLFQWKFTGKSTSKVEVRPQLWKWRTIKAMKTNLHEKGAIYFSLSKPKCLHERLSKYFSFNEFKWKSLSSRKFIGEMKKVNDLGKCESVTIESFNPLHPNNSMYILHNPL